MPLQNRVTPTGRLEAVPARGAWTGNRGIIHNERREVVAQWRSKAWITCLLSFRGRRRPVFSPHTWSELFFLDEATAFSAGHRPCAYCRRPRAREKDVARALRGAAGGSFVLMSDTPCLLWSGRLLQRSHEGYGRPLPEPDDGEEVAVLTPPSVVAMFRAGFRPQVHESVGACPQTTAHRPPRGPAHRW